MRRTMVVTAAVLACALAVCFLSMGTLSHAVSGAGRLVSQAVLAAQEGRTAQAKSLMVELAEFWKARSGLLEMIASHDALHEVDAAVAEAQICLECRDHDDFLRTMSNARMALQHLWDEEVLSWANLY